MQVGKTYSLFQTLNWTRRYLIIFLFTSTVPVLLYEVAGLHWIVVPWLPIALIGTAVAFYLGFKNNSSYERLWEARKIWGAIVNDSRLWTVSSRDFITNQFAPEPMSEEELASTRQRMVYRHIGWLIALRHQLRAIRSWEHQDAASAKLRDKLNTHYRPEVMRQDLSEVLSEKDLEYIMSKVNPAAHIISLQSKELKELRAGGFIDDFRHMRLQENLKYFYDHQGKSERIKNFPFPRQYATVNLFFVWLFILLVPFGMIEEFNQIGEHFVWLTIPFSIIISWVFHTMEMIGDYSENPFEGLWNDVPITSLARTIEIDLREMIEEKDLPQPVEAVPGINIIY